MFVDTHAHLFFDNFKDDFDDVMARAKDNGIDYIIIPSTDIKTAKQTLELCDKHEMLYAAVGVHPHDTKDWDDSLLAEIEKLAEHKKVVAIGEIGLDYYYDFSPKSQQKKAFRSQIELALKLDLPVVIHNRDSDEDMMEIISGYCGSGLKAQFHCFNGSLNDSIELQKMSHFISFTGNITFKKSEDLRNILTKTNLNHLMLETDSPFMTPVPHRGKRNEPAYVKYVAKKVAELHNMTAEEIGKITSINVFRFFGIGNKPKPSFTYKLDGSLYINITNRCNADCSFCRRRDDPFIRGYNLGMKRSEEPKAEVYIEEIGDPKNYKEIVFCGYGEPTIRWDVVKEISGYVKKNGGKTRLNTNGHGNKINHRDITPEMKDLIDEVSISFNTFDPAQYAELMKLDQSYFFEMLDFAKKAKPYTKKVVLSVVNIDNVEIEQARNFVKKNIGAEFRVRDYF